MHLGSLTIRRDVLGEIRLLAAAWLIVLALGVVLFVARRMATDVIIAPLDWSSALGVGVATVAAFSLPHVFVMRVVQLQETPFGRIYAVCLQVVTFLWGVAVSLSLDTALAITCLWIPIVAADAMLLFSGSRGLIKRAILVSEDRESRSERMVGFAWKRANPTTSADDESKWRQFMVRRGTESNLEVIEGWQQVHILPGQRTAVIHVVFCPPFSTTPDTIVECLSQPKTRTRVTQVLPHGARLEVKLASAASTEQSLRIGYRATGLAALPA